MNQILFFFALLFVQQNIIFVSSIYSNKSKNIYFDSSNYENNKILNKKLLKSLLSYETDMIDFEILGNLQYKGTTLENTTEKFYDILRGELELIINASDISEGCEQLLKKYLIFKDKNSSYHYSSNYHIKKLLDDSSKHKNDLGSYDQCLHRKYRRNNEKGDFTDSTYIVFTLDKSNIRGYENKLIYKKDRTDFEDIYYVRAFCLPQATKENYNNYCSNEDYIQFMNTTNNDLGDLLGIRNVTYLKVFNLEKIESKSKFFAFLKSIPLILCIFHVFIIIFRELIMYFVKRYYINKNSLKNKEIKEYITPKNKKDDDDDSDDDDDEDEDEKDKKEKNNKKIDLPRWIKIYNKCFNFSQNFKELFNFKLNSTNINNDSGLSYIRGLKGSSLFLLILGLTFLTFMNSLSKIFSKTLFFEFLDNKLFYSLFFIGLRYSPRIIFSCSGYTLAYKYLCYINRSFNRQSIFKFIFYQSHKYLMLITCFLYERYSLYEFFDIDTPVWKYLYLNILKKPDGARFLLSFLTLSSVFAIDVGSSRYQQTLIDYFWLPYNEVFFFIIGITIISIGYNYKLRIDYFLIITTIVLSIFKIIYSYIIKTKEKEIYYATLYYYLFDYGKYMLNPLFNLPCYLIGMYFGLINYSVQKGIISLNTLDLFNSNQKKEIKNEEEMDLKYITPTDKKNKDEEEEDDDDDVDNIGKINDSEYNVNKNKNINKKENEDINYRIEIKEMPFLISGVKISSWLRVNKVRLLSVIIALIIILFISFHFIVLSSTVGSDYKDLKNKMPKNINTTYENEEIEEIEEKKIEDLCNKIDELLTLSKYLSNNFINFILRIDIEIVVFLSQTLLFIFYFKGQNFINDFYCHVFWAMLNKAYFSYILIANIMILFIFYQSETKILLNLYNILLYSLISGSLIFLNGTFAYLFFELPYKRLIHFISSDDNISELEDNETEIEEEKEGKTDDGEED